jgi:hypothetical protein
VLCVLTGMSWGMWMGAHQDVTMAPAHAHLNLLGFVAPSIMGTFYALAGDRAPVRLAWINFVLSLGGVVILIPMLAKLLAGDASIGPMMVVPELIVVAGMATFLLSIITVARGAGSTVGGAASAPAE